jgi:hypothetical protein
MGRPAGVIDEGILFRPSIVAEHGELLVMRAARPYPQVRPAL